MTVNHSTLTVGMSREKESNRPPLPNVVDLQKLPICEKCGETIWTGDWPFCKGNPVDHLR